MSEFNFNCPFCHHSFAWSPSDGEYIPCPHCQCEINMLEILHAEKKEPPQTKTSSEIHSSSAVSSNEAPEPHTVKSEPDLCPYCGESVSPMAITCPHCHQSISRCPQCGLRGMMEYHDSALGTAKGVAGATAGAIAGGILLGPVGAILGGIGGLSQKRSGYLKCKACGYIFK